MCFVIGNDAGATIWGTLFYHVGTRKALITFAAATGFLVATLMLYTSFSKKAIEYEKIPDHDDDDDDKDNNYYDDDC